MRRTKAGIFSSWPARFWGRLLVVPERFLCRLVTGPLFGGELQAKLFNLFFGHKPGIAPTERTF